MYPARADQTYEEDRMEMSFNPFNNSEVASQIKSHVLYGDIDLYTTNCPITRALDQVFIYHSKVVAVWREDGSQDTCRVRCP